MHAGNSMNPWSLFWSHGHSTTFGDYFKQGYTGAVADWWRSALDNLPGDSTVLEVGCGNCSLLPAMIDSKVRGRYIGVDIAKVQMSEVASQNLPGSGLEIILHSETRAEDIPEPDTSVDLAASVFGIEYSDLDQSLPEIFRLLKPGGRFAALLHHDNSVVTTMSRRAISEYNDYDLEKVISALQTISMERDRSPTVAALKTNPRAEKSRNRINRMAQKYLANTDLKTANATMFEFMTQALKFFKMMNADSAARGRFIASLREEHKASHERFGQMVSVALNEKGIEDIKAKLDGLGFGDITSEVVYSNGNVLAWALSAAKSPAAVLH